MPPYSQRFYASAQGPSQSSAEVIVPLVLRLVEPRSVIDVGCGTGEWLAVFISHGVADVWGVDGPWVQTSGLHFPADRFQVYELRNPLRLARRFDLVVSLEVAEHLPAASAGTFVDSLTRLGPVVLFSAAIPHQRGTGHHNEQWPAYWSALFRQRGFEPIDYIRRQVWNETAVCPWYAQNTLLFVHADLLRDDCLPELQNAYAAHGGADPLPLVHPALYLDNAVPQRMGLRQALAVLPAIPAIAMRAISRRWRYFRGQPS
jgi:SAM-dependent methyltransferase